MEKGMIDKKITIEENSFGNTKPITPQMPIKTLGQNEPRVKQLLADIVDHRNKLPKNWTWKKCYEIEYKHIGIKKHWALKCVDNENAVASYRLLLQDLTLRRDEIDEDATMLFIEKSLEYIDCLLEIVSKQSV